jgi:hypothetical protein
MAWTAPATWSVSEVVLASKMNLHVRDNLKYLKGQAGAVAIEDALMIGSAAAPGYQAHVFATDSTATRTGAIGAEAAIENGSTGGVRSAGLRFRAADTGATVRSAARILGSFAAATFADTQLVLQTMSAAETFQDVMVLRGVNVGIGTAAPAGKLHVAAAGGVTTAGMVFGSVAAVTSIQTIFAAGTVSRQATFIIFDRNNTGGAGIITYPVNSVLLANNMTYVNNDTITIAVTAGGAITAQRTVGTNGTHDIVMLAMVQ